MVLSQGGEEKKDLTNPPVVRKHWNSQGSYFNSQTACSEEIVLLRKKQGPRACTQCWGRGGSCLPRGKKEFTSSSEAESVGS